MTQIAALRALDDQLMSAFLAAGLADSATYTPKGGGSAVACRVYIDRDLQRLGEFGQVVGQKTQFGFLLAEVIPRAGAIVVVGGESWKLDNEISRDESRSRWTATPIP